MSRKTEQHVSVGEHQLKREFKLFSSFAFAFAFISPIVALYGIFGLALTAAGPSFWWGFFIVFLGQLLVALVFAMLVSRWPIEGSIYQWSARLAGRAYGWFAGWVYVWTLVIAMATVALGAAGFIANIFGIEAPSGTLKASIAFGVLIAGTLVNIAGQQVLKVFMTASIAAEVIGSIGLGTWLLLFHRVNDISVLFNGNTDIPTDVPYLSIGGPFLVAVAFIGFSFVGFESAGSIAEEVHDPRRNLPKAIIFALSFIAVVVTYSSLAIILATPDLAAVTAGQVPDPVFTTLTTQLGRGIAVPVEALFVIGFLASFLALQTSASRMIWATARDGGLPGSHVLSRLSKNRRQPVAAILVTTVIGSLLFLLSYVAENIYTIMVNFTSGGFFLSFLFPLAGFVVVLIRRTWKAGVFSLGGATIPIAIVALVWAFFEFVNIAWPRPAYPEAYLNWSIVIGIGAIAVLGVVIYPFVKKSLPRVRGQEYRMLGEIEVPPGDEAELDGIER